VLNRIIPRFLFSRNRALFVGPGRRFLARPQFDDPRVQFVALPGTRGRKATLIAHMQSGTTLVLNESSGISAMLSVRLRRDGSNSPAWWSKLNSNFRAV
jgi:hypothetical protein